MGTNRVDTITGSNSADIITAASGGDTANAGGGDDQVNGDAGNDTLNGGGGTDYLEGGRGKNALDGQAGDSDVVNVVDGDGDDFASGGDGKEDICIIDAGKDPNEGSAVIFGDEMATADGFSPSCELVYVANRVVPHAHSENSSAITAGVLREGRDLFQRFHPLFTNLPELDFSHLAVSDTA